LAVAGIQPGDHVLTTPFSFAATANTIVHAGARPVFADIEPESLNLTVETLERARTSRTRAVVVVHVAGNIAEMDAIAGWCQQHRLTLIEDCAHALGAWRYGRHAGSWGVGGAFSFYPNKNITTGEGGMVASTNPESEGAFRHWRNHGLDYPPYDREQATTFRQYDIVLPGYKANLSDLQAALGRCQLQHLPEWQRQRAVIYQRYSEAFNPTGLAHLYTPPPGSIPAHHLANLRLNLPALSRTRDELLARILARGVQLSVAFKPIHLFSYYERQGWQPTDCPEAVQAWEGLFSLPIYPLMTNDDVEYVIENVLNELHQAKR
jgi:dTDP-4-amino-4,6-dideoxygalactose transaminase